METYQEYLIKLENLRFDRCSPGKPQETDYTARKLEITVLFTFPKLTAAAARHAAGLLRGLDGRIMLIDVQPIPCSLPLDHPPVSLDFSKKRLLAIVRQSPVEITAEILLCRFRFEALLCVLKPGSVVLVGCRRRWWPSWERQVARKLRCAGYETVLIKTS